MISCNLTKPESAFDQVRKIYADLKPTDAALIATALVECGRFAVAVRADQDFRWPKDHGDLVRDLVRDINNIQETLGAATKKAKGAEDEPITLDIQLKANLDAGESVLGNREDLKTLLADILDQGVEYLYSPTDIGWQWSLERVNWATVSGGDLGRRFRFRATFEGSSTGVELGPGGKRKTPKKRGAKEEEE